MKHTISVTDGAWFKPCDSLDEAMRRLRSDPSLRLVIDGIEFRASGHGVAA